MIYKKNTVNMPLDAADTKNESIKQEKNLPHIHPKKCKGKSSYNRLF